MATTMLVTYATKYGSTREVAEAIAASLNHQGVPVEIRPAGKVRTLDGYRAVVLGAALYMGRWHKDARDWTAIHAWASKLGSAFHPLPTGNEAGTAVRVER